MQPNIATLVVILTHRSKGAIYLCCYHHASRDVYDVLVLTQGEVMKQCVSQLDWEGLEGKTLCFDGPVVAN